MHDIEIKKEVIKYLEDLPVYLPNSTYTQHVVRCPYCGDSNNQSHGHFSIKINLETDEPMVYRCFKCDTSGLLTNSVLEELNIDISDKFYKNFKMYIKNSKKKLVKYNIITKAPDYEVPLYTSNNLNNKKLNYINNRLSLNLSFSDWRECKAIFNLYDFIKLNEIKYIPEISINKLQLLNDEYIGFLSSNNNCIIFRNIYKNYNRRYEKIKINPNLINPNSFYNIPTSFDILYTNKIDIHIAEGIMDIQSIYNNLCDRNNENNFYFAACGFGYVSIIKYMLSIGLNTGIRLHIYSDNDKENNDHFRYLKKLNKSALIWIDDIFIHRNIFEGEKDYGIPKRKIEDSYIKIK